MQTIERQDDRPRGATYFLLRSGPSAFAVGKKSTLCVADHERTVAGVVGISRKPTWSLVLDIYLRESRDATLIKPMRDNGRYVLQIY